MLSMPSFASLGSLPSTAIPGLADLGLDQEALQPSGSSAEAALDQLAEILPQVGQWPAMSCARITHL